MATIRPADFGSGSSDPDLCRILMREYAAFLNASVGGEHICVESLEAELAALPGSYTEPGGAVLLAFDEEEPAGCVALKPLHLPEDVLRALKDPLSERACEMKRLWVRPSCQGTGLGRRLSRAIVQAARERGYTAMYLDTMPASMKAAYALYRSMGFEPVEPYTQNPVLRQTGSLEIAFLRKNLR
jgi:putative acetyltransferase